MWVERGAIIEFKKKDPDGDFVTGIPYLVTGVVHFTHGIIDLALLTPDGTLLPTITTNTKFIKIIQGINVTK